MGLLQEIGGAGMKEIDQNNLDTAMALGDAVCNDLGICCRKRGQIIFQIYGRLEELKHKEDTPNEQNVPPHEAKQNTQPLPENSDNA